MKRLRRDVRVKERGGGVGQKMSKTKREEIALKAIGLSELNHRVPAVQSDSALALYITLRWPWYGHNNSHKDGEKKGGVRALRRERQNVASAHIVELCFQVVAFWTGMKVAWCDNNPHTLITSPQSEGTNHNTTTLQHQRAIWPDMAADSRPLLKLISECQREAGGPPRPGSLLQTPTQHELWDAWGVSSSGEMTMSPLGEMKTSTHHPPSPLSHLQLCFQKAQEPLQERSPVTVRRCHRRPFVSTTDSSISTTTPGLPWCEDWKRSLASLASSMEC